MAMILKKGRVPASPHTEFYSKKGVLALEEIHGSYGFSGPHSRKMHTRAYPTQQSKAPQKGDFDLALKPAADGLLQPYHILTSHIPYEGDPIRSRKPIVFGSSTIVSISKPVKSSPANTFFRNGEKHELYYVQEGQGEIQSEYGVLPFREQLYVAIPKGTTYRIVLKSKKAWFLVVESNYLIGFPPHNINAAGQATLMSPVVETQIETPRFAAAKDQKGTFFVDVKHSEGKITRLTLNHHPFDLVGWEGALYPFAFDIKNHHAYARDIHTAPPLHQTFQSGNAPYNGFSICSFVSQMEGWHAKEIPAPYAHNNVDSDEVMFFSNANYGARKGVIEPGSFTFHPGSLPHSPQGLAAMRSMAVRGKMNDRLAVMLDTFFESLTLTETGYKYRDKEYALSWHKAAQAHQNGSAPVEVLHGT